MKLRDLVSGRPHICGADATLREVAGEMADNGLGSMAVIEGRRLIGILTERDLVRAMAGGVDVDTVTVRSQMGAEPDVFDAGTDVFDAAEWLIASRYRHLPVVDDDELLGVVSLRDLLRSLLQTLDEEE